MSKSKSFLPILIPSATVFFSSGCIMVLELVAGRLIARHFGSSLYTWTSVIGVVLLGITIGNYLGGRIADRFLAKKALAMLLAISSVACVVIVVLNNLVGDWILLWKFSWPMHVFSHVSLVFLIPSTLLGTISPVVAKMALDKELPTGRTVGDIYAWGAAGSIAGTFATGYYLIAAMGTVTIIWTVGASLLLMAILYWARLWVLYLWAVIFVALMTMGTAPVEWAKYSGAAVGLREKADPKILYEDESQYCYIAVKQLSDDPDKREFVQDKLTHSVIMMNNIRELGYGYEQIYAAATHRLSRDKNKLSVLGIGGGGYVFPRYVGEIWPGSRVDVAEIDPAVTEAAMQAFGLKRDTTINTFTMDARNYVDELLKKIQKAEKIPRYDFIYEDAVNDYSVPYQLVTKEFNDKIYQILKDDGVYMVNVIDIYDSGLFLGACVNTLEKTFPYVHVVTKNKARSKRNTFVIIASKEYFNLEGLNSEEPAKDSDLWILSDSDMETLRKKARRIVLTDNYAPVENMLAPVVRQSALSHLSNRYLTRARKLESQGKLDESIAIYKELIKVDPTESIMAYNNIGQILAGQGKWLEAIDAAKSAIEYNEKAKVKHSMSDIHYNVSLALEKLGRNEEASEYMHKAIEGYQEDLAQEPDSIKTLRNLGNALVEVGRFSEATKYLQQTVDMEPSEVESHLALSKALLTQQRYDEAIAVLKKAINLFSHARDERAIIEAQRYIWFIEDKSKND